MNPPAHALFDSAWPCSISLLFGVLLLSQFALWRSPWRLVIWLPLFLGPLLCALGFGLILLSAAAEPASPGTFSPLAFAGPVVIALILTLPLLAFAWFIRPSKALLKKRHWRTALIALPLIVFAAGNSPGLFSHELLIQFHDADGRPIPQMQLQIMQPNEVIAVGPPLIANPAGQFKLRINSLESFTAVISAPGYENCKLSLFPHRSAGVWSIYTGKEEPEKLPLKDVALDLPLVPKP